MNYTKEDVINYFKNKYSYISDIDIEIMYDCAYDIMFNLRYPYHNDIEEMPSEYLNKHRTWILRAIQEHIDREGMTNVISYSENGVSVQFDNTGLSSNLRNEIKPLAKVGNLKR